MKQKALLLCAAIGLLALASPTTWAQNQSVDIAPINDRPDVQPPRPDPEAIAKRCANAVNGIAKKCVEANENTTKRCVNAINKLQAEGYHGLAKRLARNCAHRITRRSNSCVYSINMLCRRCVNALGRLHAPPELIRRVVNVCEVARKKVRSSQKHSIMKIREAVRNRTTDRITDGA